MKPVVCLYCEGTDVKLATIGKAGDNLKVLRVASLTLSHRLQFAHSGSRQELMAEIEHGDIDAELSLDRLESSEESSQDQSETSDVTLFHSALQDLKISNLDYIPIVTEPAINFHLYDGPKDPNKKKLIQSIKNDLQVTKGIVVDNDSIDAIELNEKTMLTVFIEGEIPAVSLINQLANYNNRRYLKIPTVKTAELSLAYYVSQNTKFFPEDYSLIIYIGKEYSKLIFLEGQKLKHIGSALDIGTKNLHTYDVYFSKILLEMENGGVPKLDNIILCGEDRSENLILSFYGTFPEANVSELKFENIDYSVLNEEDAQNLALYAIPISVGVEYFDELSKRYAGVNFLPKYIQENQKTFQFGWHSYAVLPLLFGATFFFTFNILSNYKEIKDLDFEIERLTQRQLQNQTLVDQITPLDARINSFDATQSILDSASVGTGIWNKNLSKISDFIERRRSFWVTKLETIAQEEIKLTGYSLVRSVLTEFADYNKVSLLKSINYEPLRDKSAFAFTLSFKMTDEKLNKK